MTPDMTCTQLAPDVRRVVDDTLEHFNANHADTVLLLACHAAGALGAIDAEAVAVDAEGVDFDVRIGDRRTTARMPFAATATTADEVSQQVMTLLGQARQHAGEAFPLTSLEREMAHQGTIPTHLAEVITTRRLTPHPREVVIGGPGLAGFESVGGDQFAYVLVARAGQRLPDRYSMADWMADGAATRPHGGYYTVRDWDPTSARMVLWAVAHGHPEGVGGWFDHSTPGERLALWGPRPGFWAEGTYAPDPTGEGRHHLFVADESGFGAVAALLAEVDPHDTATVLAETVDEAHAIQFPGDRTNVIWHYRGGAAPGVGTGLYDLVTHVAGGAAGRAPATAFGAGESRQITRIRSYLRHELGMSAAHVSMTGYWRRGA
jgi:NADPH-dependent ferric siderophore reductase